MLPITARGVWFVLGSTSFVPVRLCRNMATTELFPNDVEEIPARPLLVVGPLEALRRHKFLAILPLVLLTAAGIGAGLRHKPVFTATSQMWVTGSQLNSPGGLSDYTVAAAGLAATYSRLATSRPVTMAVGKSTRLTADAVQGQVSATPVPSSPIFNVTATTGSANTSIVLANATSSALAGFVSTTLRQTGPTRAAYRQFQNAVTDLNAKQTVRDTAQRLASQSPTTTSRANLTTARTQYDIALARVQTLQTQYQGLQASSSSHSGSTSVLTPAASAFSDKTSYLHKTAFAGLVAGLLLGLALATLRANLLARRWRESAWR
jgi:uncharacterized protein involved in exopolysaccharide biosynthesis